MPPPPLPLSDITAHEPQERLSHSDVADSLTNPVSEEGQEESTAFEFDEKDGAVEDLSRATMEQTERIDTRLEVQDSHIDQGITTVISKLRNDILLHAFT